MDVDLPVWTIRPNWATGIVERLEWQTDVLASDTGVEQRRSTRLSPRRSFEFTVNPARNDRTYLDLLLHRLGSKEWLLPLWHDQARLTTAAPANQRVLAFDNLFREHQVGSYAICYFDTFTWEIVQVAAQDANGITVTEDLSRPWPKGTKLFPIRKALVQTDTSLKALTSRVGESTLLFQINEANDYPEMAGDAMAEYQGSPLLVLAPDRSKEITTDQTRLYDQQDGDTGLIYRTDLAGRAFAVQSHGWQVHGREAHAAFRSFLYTLRGRQRMVWLPTFNDDLLLAKAVPVGAVAADIEAVGMSYVGSGGPIPGRATLWTGSEVVQIASILAPGAPGREKLGLRGPTTAAYAPGASWGFLQAARLDQDLIELHHHTDSDGTMEVAAGFHTFADARDASGSTFQPLPAGVRSDEPCGAPVGLNPCHQIFDGTYYSVIYTAEGCNPNNFSEFHLFPPPEAFSPNGSAIVGNMIFGTDLNFPVVQTVHETYEAGSATLRGQLLFQLVITNNNQWRADYYFPMPTTNWNVFSKPYPGYCGSVGQTTTHADVTSQGYQSGSGSHGRKEINGDLPATWNW